MYEVIFYLKSGNIVNIGKVDSDRADMMVNAFDAVKHGRISHRGDCNGFYYSFDDVEMVQFKEVE